MNALSLPRSYAYYMHAFAWQYIERLEKETNPAAIRFCKQQLQAILNKLS